MNPQFFLGLGPNGFHRIAYVEWGEGREGCVLCVHGLTRNGRDFDRLAAALAGTRRVVCPTSSGAGKATGSPTALATVMPSMAPT